MVFLDPNFAKTSTTETPLHFQTPDPQDVTPANGEKSNFLCVTCVWVTFFCPFVVTLFISRLRQQVDPGSLWSPLSSPSCRFWLSSLFLHVSLAAFIRN